MKRPRHIAALIAASLLLAPSLVSAQDFLGLRLGLSADQASKVTGKQIVLENYKTIRGRKIVNDTILFGECAEFRRSLGFDSLGRLSVIGLTHRSSAEQTDQVKGCVANVLSQQYGAFSIDSITNDTVQMHIWRTADAMLTMDARPYNERHSFVSVYYFKRERTARKEENQ